jgi:hypothetical protein
VLDVRPQEALTQTTAKDPEIIRQAGVVRSVVIGIGYSYEHGREQARSIVMQWIRKRLLIWGTTYPEFSKKYYETVCTGAIDGDTGKLLRIYPVTLRHLEQRFRHYHWIEADVARNTSDVRPESYRIKQDTIVVKESIPTDGGWIGRREWVLRPGNVFKSLAALLDAQAADGTSLGLIKPGRILGVRARKRTDEERAEWIHQRDKALAIKDLFVDVDAKTRDLVLPGVEYRMRFLCADIACTTEHDMSVLDWGVYALSRKQYRLRGRQQAEHDVIAQLERSLDMTKRDAYLFLGNSLAHPRAFMIVGLFYPPIIQAPVIAEPPQLRLL